MTIRNALFFGLNSFGAAIFRLKGALVYSALLFSAASFVSCAKGTPIQLTGEQAPPRPTNPQKPTNPDTPPDTIAVGENSYGVFCEFPEGDGSLLMKTSSRASASATNVEIQIGAADLQKSRLRAFSGVAPLKAFEANGSYRAQLLFEAQAALDTPGVLGPRKVYFSEIDLGSKSGEAQPLATAVALDLQAVALAKKLGLSLRNHGVSSHGKYLILPSAQGKFDILLSSTHAIVGSVGLSPQTNFFPMIDEDTATFSALQYNGGRFANTLIALSTSGNALVATRSLGLLAPAPGFTQLPLQTWPKQKVAFAEVPLNALGSRVTLVTISIFNSESTQMERTDFIPVAGARVAPWTAVYETHQGNAIFVVATEKIQSSANAASKVNFAELVGVVPGTGAHLFEAPYPDEVVTEIERGGYTSLTLTALVSSPDHRAVFATLPKRGVPMVFKLVENLDSFSISGAGINTCLNPSVVKEEF
jgi:hypothetical protein